MRTGPLSSQISTIRTPSSGCVQDGIGGQFGDGLAAIGCDLGVRLSIPQYGT
ncbi:MAG TPA: hypothetical protein VK053_12475 [Jiangellaceae bacterium]|nr:hypothetical protein [Jiangellaceae bacterium]